MIAFGTSDFSAAQTAAASALDTLSTQTGSSLHGLLHCTAVGDTLLQLCSDVLSNQLSVQVGAADLNDVQSDGLAQLGFDLLTQLFDLLAALADQ